MPEFLRQPKIIFAFLAVLFKSLQKNTFLLICVNLKMGSHFAFSGCLKSGAAMAAMMKIYVFLRKNRVQYLSFLLLIVPCLLWFYRLFRATLRRICRHLTRQHSIKCCVLGKLRPKIGQQGNFICVICVARFRSLKMRFSPAPCGCKWAWTAWRW